MQAATPQAKGSYTITGESVRVTNKAQNTRFHFGADKTLVIAKGMTYCASVLYKLNSGTDSLFLQFETKNSSGAKVITAPRSSRPSGTLRWTTAGSCAGRPLRRPRTAMRTACL